MSKMALRTGFLLLLAGPLLYAGTCANGTLADYIALPANGCTVDGISFFGFGFSIGPSGGGITPVGAADINLTPISGGAEPGLSFSSSGFNIISSQFVTYLITYTEDPDGDIRSMDDVLDDPVMPPAVGRVDSLGCLDASFTPALTCPSTQGTVSVSVFDAGTSRQLTNSVNFNGVHTLGILQSISLDARNGGNVSINSFAASSFIPEPSTGWLAAVPVLALLLAYKMRLKRLQTRFYRRT